MKERRWRGGREGEHEEEELIGYLKHCGHKTHAQNSALSVLLKG